jgi:hypothetical protein
MNNRKVTSTRSHVVLQHLDNILALLRLKYEEVVETVKLLLQQKPREQMLEFWSIDPQILYKIIKLHPNILEFEINCHRYLDATGRYWKLNVLDFLTSLCLFMDATWKDKLDTLFDWFNTSKSNILNNSEHYLLMKSI